MCARYKLSADWQNFPVLKPDDFIGNADVRPTHRMPVVRLIEGQARAEMRHWGFLRAWPGPSGKIVKHQLFNAVGEELSQKRAFKKAFETSRCLVPMSAWYEWPVVDGSKRKMEIAMKARGIFAVAGLFEISTHPDSGIEMPTYTIVTAAPNRQLRAVHDRAPLVLPKADWATWLEGERALAQALIGPYPEEEAFVIRAADLPPEGLFAQ